jgi:hypothetical protein
MLCLLFVEKPSKLKAQSLKPKTSIRVQEYRSI